MNIYVHTSRVRAGIAFLLLLLVHHSVVCPCRPRLKTRFCLCYGRCVLYCCCATAVPLLYTSTLTTQTGRCIVRIKSSERSSDAKPRHKPFRDERSYYCCRPSWASMGHNQPSTNRPAWLCDPVPTYRVRHAGNRTIFQQSREFTLFALCLGVHAFSFFLLHHYLL